MNETQLALPSVGPLLGAAYDRAVTTLIRAWRVAVILLVVGCVIASVPGLAQTSFGNLILFSWGFYAMANSIRVVFDPVYRMSNRTAGEMFAAQLIAGITFALINVMAIIAFSTASQNLTAWFLAVPGFIVGIWLYARWSCGPALGARGKPAIKALGESWRLTSSAFWPTFAILCVNFIVPFAIALAIGGVAGSLLKYQGPGIVATSILIASAALVLIGQLYATQASALAICMWLKALQEVQPDAPLPKAAS